MDESALQRGKWYGFTFSSFNDFTAAVQADVSPWLDMSWQMDTEWYGIPQNTTKVEVYFDQATSIAELYCWFHITRIPEYLEGQKALDNWLTGFDLTSVSTGSLKHGEVCEDWGTIGTYYELRFQALVRVAYAARGNYTLA